MESISSRAKAYLLKQEPGFTFTGEELGKALALPFPSATSGFINSLINKEIVAITGSTRPHVYVLKDMGKLVDLRVRTAPGHGGNGTGNPRGPDRKGLPTTKSLADRLMTIAADLERIQPDLTIIGTEDLLAELTRRTREQK